MKKTYTVPKVSNAALAQGMQQLRSSGAAGFHLDKRSRRKRTRSSARAAALREWM